MCLIIEQLNKNDKLLIIELGTGTAIPTIRNISEQFFGFKSNK